MDWTRFTTATTTCGSVTAKTDSCLLARNSCQLHELHRFTDSRANQSAPASHSRTLLVGHRNLPAVVEHSAIQRGLRQYLMPWLKNSLCIFNQRWAFSRFCLVQCYRGIIIAGGLSPGHVQRGWQSCSVITIGDDNGAQSSFVIRTRAKKRESATLLKPITCEFLGCFGYLRATPSNQF